MTRERLPDRRQHEAIDFQHGGFRYVASIGHFGDGRVAEIFLTSNKAGSNADTNARDAAVVCSIALQYGAPLEVIRHALMRDSQGRASGPLGQVLDLFAGDGGFVDG